MNTTITTPNTIEAIRDEARTIFLSAKGSHDWDHTERVYNLCMHIGNIEKANTKILALSALLHDIGREAQDKSHGTLCHAEIGAEMCKEILRKYNDITPEEIEAISHCILAHRSRNDIRPETLEAKILFDSDKLDAIGAVGVGRVFLFAGEVGAKLHNDKNTDVSQTKAYTKEDTAYREFWHKLQHIKEAIFTNEGKRIAQERHDYMVGFFDRLQKEVDGEI